MPRIIFFGSSDFSQPGLQACLDSPGYEIAAVVTTPPQRQGRGLELTPTVIASFCAKKNILFREYPKLDDAAYQEIADLKPDVFVVASYGKIIPERFLALPSQRFNIHPSLLPKYRGASPLSSPILNGDAVTGLSIADITKELDAGEVYFQEECPIRSGDDSEKLGAMLAAKSYSVMRELLERARLGKVTGSPQDSNQASYAKKLNKEDGRLTLQDTAQKWDRIIRGLKPWPGAFIEMRSERLGLITARPLSGQSGAKVGQLLSVSQESMVVQVSEGAIELLLVKPAGKKGMRGGDYARGRRWNVGMNLA
ncbi:MAG TPA: methionyl-tRNA formyltransferase [Candidatus Omnitrophota bacterium]|nr:methionyl-tRNA formyltransferase [Candidatus Omnitrophota bacterium]